MKLKLNIKTEDELDLEAFERDLVLSDYMEKVESNQLSPEEKRQREVFLSTIGDFK